MYRVTTFYSITGLVKSVELSDFAYGEWIIYENRIPKYHVNCFDKISKSNILIKNLLENKKETIVSLVDKISKGQNANLSLSNKPKIKIIKYSAMEDLKLIPLPEFWIKNISS